MVQNYRHINLHGRRGLIAEIHEEVGALMRQFADTAACLGVELDVDSGDVA